MKLQSIDLIPVKLPYKRPVSDAWGVYPASFCGIVVAKDEAGLEGYGEISLAWFGGVHNLCKDAQENWIPSLLGMDTGDLTAINEILDSFCTFSRRNILVKAGIEMAIWDLLGKELKMPVYKLLGGKLRNELPLTGGIAMESPEEMMEQANRAVEAGFRELKIKVGLDDKKDLEVVRAIRAVIPDDIALRADANMAWTNRKQAKYLMDALFDYGVHMVEQPLDYRDIEGLKWLRENSRCKVLIDEGIWDWHDAAKYIMAGAADLLHVYACEAGGIMGMKRVFDTAGAFSMECTIGSMPEGIVGASAAAHVAAAMSNLSRLPSDLRGFTVFADDVATTPMRIQNGRLILPDGIGLGFEIDAEKLEKLRTDR